MFQEWQTLEPIRQSQPLRGYIMAIIACSMPQVSEAFNPIEFHILQDALWIKAPDIFPSKFSARPPVKPAWIDSVYHPVDLNLILPGHGHDETMTQLHQLQADYPQLAQYLADVEWQQNSDLSALLTFFLEHSAEAAFFNTLAQVNAHRNHQVIDLNDPAVIMMQFIQGNPETRIFELLQIAPMLAQFLVDTGTQTRIREIINKLVRYPEIAGFLNTMKVIKRHPAGKKVDNSHIMLKNLRTLFCLDEENIQVINKHISSPGFYFSLSFWLTASNTFNAFADLSPTQLITMVEHPALFHFFQRLAGDIQPDQEQIYQYMQVIVDYISETGDKPGELSHLELIMILVRRLLAPQISSLQSSPLLNHIETCVLPSVITGADSAVVALFLMTYHQNLLSYLNGQIAQFTNTDASALFDTILRIQNVQHSSLHNFLQKLIDHPEKINDSLQELSFVPALIALDQLTASGEPGNAAENLVMEAVETEGSQPAGESFRSFLATLPMSRESKPDNSNDDRSFNAAHIGILKTAARYIPDGHPVNDTLIALAYYSYVPINQLDMFMSMAQSLLMELDMVETENYNRIHFVIRLISLMADNSMPPFQYIQQTMLQKKHPALSRAVQEYLRKQLGGDNCNIEQTAIAMVHMMAACPELFMMLGPRHLATPQRSCRHLIQILSDIPETLLPQVIEFLFIQPCLLATPVTTLHCGGSLELLLMMILRLDPGPLRTLSGLQLFLLHAALVSHSCNFVPVVPHAGHLAAGFLHDIVQQHLVPIAQQHSLEIDSEILVAFLMYMISDLEQVMNPVAVMKILERYFY